MVYREFVPKHTNIWKHHNHRELSPALWAFGHHQVLSPWTVDVLGEQFVLEYGEIFYRETTFTFVGYDLKYLPEIFGIKPTGKEPARKGL